MKKIMSRNPVHEGARKPSRQAKIEAFITGRLFELAEFAQAGRAFQKLRDKFLKLQDDKFRLESEIRRLERGLSPRKKNSHGLRASKPKTRYSDPPKQSKRAGGQPRTRKGQRRKASR